MPDANKQVQLGQTVQLEVLESGSYRINIVPLEQSSHKIIEVGSDYLVFDEGTAGIIMRIPVHLIKCVTSPPTPVTQAA